uniref:Uncharacterized protein n=1 Tax=Anopheles christyi TaxID=43041 RepID=A0A182JVP6_9DIPT
MIPAQKLSAVVRSFTMKPKKQQSSSAAEKKPSSGGSAGSSAAGSAGHTSISAFETEAKFISSSSSPSTAPAKKSVKRLQSKTKESAPNSTVGSGVAVTNTSVVKSTEKIPSNIQQNTIQQQTQFSKSKSSANASKTACGVDTAESSKIGAKSITEPAISTTSSVICGTTGAVVGKCETFSAGKGNKQHVAKATKHDSVGSPTATNSTVKVTGKEPADRSRKPTKETVSATKRNAGQTDKSDAAKRKQSGNSCNSSTVCSVGDSGDNRSTAAGILTSSSIESKLREKEKKIQKELKNLGVPDKTINQSIDAAYLLKSAEESVVNPSISEMVKTKSRTTVAQGKYGGGGGGGDTSVGFGTTGRKSSATSEEPSPSAEGGESLEKSTKESISSAAGKSKKTVTLKLDHQPSGEGHKKMSGKGTSMKDADEKLPSKTARKDDKTASTSTGVSATAVKTSSIKGAGQGAKSNKKANNSSGSSDLKQKKISISECVSKVTEQQKTDVTSELPVVKQSSEQEGTMTIGRGSSIEQEDQEEKNEEVHIRIDSIVKALEREDIETSSAIKKESDDETRKQEAGDGAIAIPPADSADSKNINEMKTKKQPTPRKPPTKKEGSVASPKSKTKEANEKKKASVVDQVNKKEVKFQEQTPASPAKRKYAKKPKSGTEDTASGEKPAKMAKSATVKKVSSMSKVKQANVKTHSKIQTVATDPAVTMFSVNNDEIALTTSSKDIKAIESSGTLKEQAVSTAIAVSSRDRSSTENDDDVPLRQLQQKQNPLQPAVEGTAPSAVKNLEVSQLSMEKDEQKTQVQLEEQTKKECSDIGPETNVPQSASGTILAGLLKSSGKQGKRSYVRKNASASLSGKSTKVAASSGPCAGSSIPEECHSKETKLEKKDVYDFDDSESEIDAPVKAGKPNFKRKSSVDISQSREDISRDTLEDTQTAKQKVMEGKKEELRSIPPCVDSDGEREKCDEDEDKKRIVPLKKQKRRIEAAISEVSSMKKEHKSGESSDSEKEQEDADAADKKTKKKTTPHTKKLKQETKEGLHSSADEADDDDEGVDDADDDEDNGSADSDGCSSTDTVRTRIAKKRQSAKKRNVKLYGFWSGPKRHRVASLNALAKVHCLYENEMRGALEASLMSQSSGSRVIRTITKDGERIKKERICPDEESAGEESRSGETLTSEMAQHGKGKEPEQSMCKEPERKESVKKNVEKKENAKNERKEAPSQQQKQADDAAREEVIPKVKEEAPKKDSDQDSAESSEEEPVVMRNLRCAPGLRGAGKHWDPDASSLESEIEQLPDSDETYAQGKDTDPTRKRKVKKKVVRKSKAKSGAVQTKSEKDKEKLEKASEKTEKAPKAQGKKIKKELKALLTDNERQEDGAASSSSTGSEKAESGKRKQEDVVKKRKREPKSEKAEPGGDYKDYIGKKRMASLNASAMMAATYEVQRVLYRNTDSSDSECSAERVPKSKKTAKDSKDHKENASVGSAIKGDTTKEKKESIAEKESRTSGNLQSSQQALTVSSDIKQMESSTNQPSTSNALGTISVAQQEVLTKKKKVVIKTEPMRDRKEDPMEVKREIEEPRPVSSNLVIAQDTEVTITGVYVNSSLGANQEAYCKMQYRVQQSVTEERLVRPSEAPPKSYTPLSALSSMRPPNDQTLSTPPLFVQPAQCDSPLGPPRAFYPPPTSSSGSSSAFCAPMPHDSPGKSSFTLLLVINLSIL